MSLSGSCKQLHTKRINFVSRCALLLILFVTHFSTATADIQIGIDWLTTQQNPDGSYSSSVDVSSSFQSTTETLRAYYDLDQTSQPGIPDALGFIGIETYLSTENISRLIIVAVQAGNDVTTLIEQLLQHRNFDGGFGELSGYNSSVLDTAFALEALAIAGYPLGEVTAGAVLFLSDLQYINGGWADSGNDSSVYVSALVMHALWHYKTNYPGINPILVAAKDYLISNQAPGGLWDETFETALVLIALINNATEYSEVAALVTELRNRQLPDGSWDGSSYASALVLRALDAQPTPEPPPPTTGEIAGRVLDANSGQAIAGATATIDGRPVTAASNTAGDFTLTALEPGDVTIRVTAPGYSERVFTGTISIGLVTGLGNVLMTPSPTTSVLRGQVTDQQTGLAIVGTTVALSGSNNVTTLTDSNGNFNFLSLTPGSVNITITQAGYFTATAAGTLVAGSAMVFNPVLTPSNIQEETSATPTGLGTLQGFVSITNSSTPIAGATVTVSGSTSASTVTVFDGTYTIPDLNPGDIEIVVSAVDHVPVTATATVTADSILTFDPSLDREVDVNPMAGRLVGSVAALGTQTPIQSVLIGIVSATVDRTIASNFNGQFSTQDLPADSYTITFSKSGYLSKTIGVVMAAGSTVDLQTIELEKETTSVSVYGTITDTDSEAPINNATVTIHNTAFTTQTDIDGNYLFEGLDVGSRTLIFNATGYESQSLVFNFNQGGAYQVDRALTNSQLSLLNFNSFSLDNSIYAAYAPVVFDSVLINSDTAVINAKIEFTILDSQDRVVAVIPASWTDAGNTQQTVFNLPPGISSPITATWNTVITPPGTYRVIARAIVGDTMVGPNTVVLAERTSGFEIEATAAIAELEVVSLPSFSGVGRIEDGIFQARVVNRSNIDSTVTFTYSLRDPGGLSYLHTNTATINLVPTEDSKIQDLETVALEFTQAGVHRVIVNVFSGAVPVNLVEGQVDVAPGVRVQPSQNLAPATVTPDEDKRLQINIRLEGVELR